MRPIRKVGGANGFLWELLTFNRLLTGPVVHLIYWAGLGVVVLIGFGIGGAAVGLAIRDPGVMGVLLALPMFVVAVLVMGVLTLLWRAFCEFYVVMFRISDDLRALRQASEAETSRQTPRDNNSTLI